jgi:hypothetical protein
VGYDQALHLVAKCSFQVVVGQVLKVWDGGAAQFDQMRDRAEEIESTLAAGPAVAGPFALGYPGAGESDETAELLGHRLAEKLGSIAAWGALQRICELADLGVVSLDPPRGATLAFGCVVTSAALAEASVSTREPQSKLSRRLDREARFAQPQFFVGYKHRLGPVC